MQPPTKVYITAKADSYSEIRQFLKVSKFQCLILQSSICIRLLL